MNWTLDQLQSFVTAAKLGSFSAAARHLGKAQSRVSSAIANLEADLGFELFDRRAKLPVLTDLGKEMLTDATSVLAQCERLNSRALTAAQSEQISLVLAGDEAVPVGSFYQVLVALEEQFPGIRMTFIHGSRDDVLQAVMEGRADFGLMFRHGDLPDNLDFQSVGQFDQRLIVSPTHPLAQSSAPTVAELQAHRQLVICDRTGVGRDKPLSANHWHIDSYFFITEMVIRNLGWALVPSHVSESDWFKDEVVELCPQHIQQALIVEVGVVKRRDGATSKVAHWLTEEFRRMLEASDLRFSYITNERN
ncbi:LysR family transcriptional regulator [Thaumasiovibrio subtropicus]|uniref:LysR family transcriptional regulator n=1 Tax=Thaumasiovibrio subtropicus TaxID=1891207 RepID=UPI000B34EEF1|nr:LysR family transcriptional regulator [Thaumasiovibrio subtropicus]